MKHQSSLKFSIILIIKNFYFFKSKFKTDEFVTRSTIYIIVDGDKLYQYVIPHDENDIDENIIGNLIDIPINGVNNIQANLNCTYFICNNGTAHFCENSIVFISKNIVQLDQDSSNITYEPMRKIPKIEPDFKENSMNFHQILKINKINNEMAKFIDIENVLGEIILLTDDDKIYVSNESKLQETDSITMDDYIFEKFEIALINLEVRIAEIPTERILGILSFEECVRNLNKYYKNRYQRERSFKLGKFIGSGSYGKVHVAQFNDVDQATGIGGVGGGIFGIPPPGRKFFENTPPWRFWENFLKNQEKRRKLGKFN